MDDEVALSAVVGGPAPPCDLRATLVVPALHPVLAGHFPGAPLVPGVLLLDAVCRAWQQASGRSARLVAVDDVRWHAPVPPGAAVTLCGRVEPAAEGVVVAGEWLLGADRVATFTVRIVAPRVGKPPVAPGAPGPARP